jgi:hypothetical protein
MSGAASAATSAEAGSADAGIGTEADARGPADLRAAAARTTD